MSVVRVEEAARSVISFCNGNGGSRKVLQLSFITFFVKVFGM